MYGMTAEGRPVEEFTLRGGGVTVRCINYGCRLTRILMPGPEEPVDVLLGFDTLEEYEADTTYQGTFVGRYANRIEGAHFTCGGTRYPLLQNDGANYLHGSWHRRVFDAEAADGGVRFTYTSPDGEDGFPGEVRVCVSYTLTEAGELVMDTRAETDADTYVNFTNHSYFNLAGAGSGTVCDHLLWLGSDKFLEANEGLCPTGRVLDARGGAFDFTAEKPVGRDIGADDPQLRTGSGYDHCFLLPAGPHGAPAEAARLRDPASGRTLRVYTTQPGIQLYTGNFLSAVRGKHGRTFGFRDGLCLETQHYPSSPQHPEFPSTLLRPGEIYREKTIYQFLVNT
jgi:aldose 1-epimerase